MYDSAHRSADTLGAGTPDPQTIEVTPEHGRPYRVEIELGNRPGTEPFEVTLGRDGTHRVEFSADAVDRLDQAGLDRLTARALGHVDGEVAATRGSRLGRFIGLHGGRLGREDVLLHDPTPGRHPRLSHTDLVHAGEFDALARLHADTPAADRPALEHELNQFIEEHGLREGVAGSDTRTDLLKSRLSEPARDLLDQQRPWWHDSDPVTAGTREFLQHTSAAARIEPIPARGADHFRIRPDGWSRDAAPFSIEIRSGDVPNGRIAEFTGSKRDGHFILTVDRARFDTAGLSAEGPGGFGSRYRFSNDLKDILHDQIAEQTGRPGVRAAGLIDRALRRAPSAVEGGTMFGLADLAGDGTLSTKSVVTSAVDVATRNRLHQISTMDRVDQEHSRGLASTPDTAGVRDTTLQGGIDGSFERAGRFAQDAFGDPDVVSRSLPSRPETPGEHRMLSEVEGGPARDRARTEMTALDRSGEVRSIDHLGRIRERADGSYRLKVPGVGRDAIVRLEAGTTSRPDRIDVEFTGPDRATLWVPKDLAQATDGALHTAVRDAVTEVAQRQFDVRQEDVGVRERVAEQLARDATLPESYVAGEALAPHLGEMIAGGTGSGRWSSR